MTSEQTASITVRIVKEFGAGSRVYTVKWRDNGRKRRIIVDIREWATADEAVVAAVRKQYPVGAQPTVTVPISAWR